MARPTLGLEKGLVDVKYLVELVHGLSLSDVEILCRKNAKQFATAFGFDIDEIKQALNASGFEKEQLLTEILTTMKSRLQGKLLEDMVTAVENLLVTKGYSYNLVLKGLQQNKPVILNEFPELQEWTFLHGLLTAIPCSDADAAPRPATIPKEGEKISNPKGWFFNTITGDWLRVPENFRICFTGNIGIEYGNTGVPPALMSRIGGGLIQIDSLPGNEITRCIAWPLLSSEETGKFLLDDEDAYKLHFLITDFFPKLQEKLGLIRDEFFSVATREIIDLCRSMHPDDNEYPCSLDEALMKTIVRPCHSRRLSESLKLIIAMLKGTGFLQGYDDELKMMDKDLDTDRTKSIIAELKNPFERSKYEASSENFKGKCMVCHVTHCPVHGKDSNEYVSYAERTKALAKMGVDGRLLQLISAYLKNLLANDENEIFIDGHLGSHEADDGAFAIDAKGRENLMNFLIEVQEDLGRDVDQTPDILDLLSKASRKLFIPKNKIDQTRIENAFDAYKKTFLDAITGNQNDSDIKIRVMAYIRARKAVKHLRKSVSDEDVINVLLPLINKFDVVELGHLRESFNGTPIVEKIDEHVATPAVKNGFLEHCNRQKIDVFGDQTKANLRKSKNRVVQSLLDTPDFELVFPKIMKLLETTEALLKLNILSSNDRMEIIKYAEFKMNQAVTSGYTPKSFTTYIRVIKKLAQIKKMNIDELITLMTKPAEIPLPPMRTY